VDLSDYLKDGKLITEDEVSVLARLLRLNAGDRQEDTAAKLGVDQSVVSRAEAGIKRYRSTCIRMVELYSGFEVEHPLYRLRQP
jgi:transcriptional regulator with XRE-family HTH domain